MKFVGPLGTVEASGVAGFRFSVTLMDVFAHPSEFGLVFLMPPAPGFMLVQGLQLSRPVSPTNYLGPRRCRRSLQSCFLLQGGPDLLSILLRILSIKDLESSRVGSLSSTGASLSVLCEDQRYNDL